MSKVPAGWEETTLEKFINIKHGFAFKSEFFSDDSEFILLTPGNFYEQGGFREQHNKTKYYIGDIPAGYILNKGDLLLAMTEQSEGLLGSAILVPENNKFLHNQRLGLVNISDAERVDYSFLYFIYNSPAVRKQIAEQSSGTKVKHTSPDRLRHVLVLLPPLPEQTKIAQILSTWDKAIATTEKLIVNSQHQKKALMQSLLTGKKRLPGFEGEWRNFKISEIGIVVTGSTPPKVDTVNYGDEYSWATAQDLKGKYVSNTVIKLSENGLKSARLLPKGAVLITCIASIGINGIAEEPLATNQQINSIIVSSEHDNEFVYYLIESKNHILKRLSGTTAVAIINKSTFSKIQLEMPCLEEQQKIAQILTAADNEIELLQKKLAFLKQEKAALMQQLLTGKRRVKVEAA